MAFSKESLLLYAVTDRACAKGKPLAEQVEQALMGGVTMLQLREKGLDDASFIREAIAVKALCDKYGVPLIINDNVDVALESRASGVHVGLEDMPVAEIRRRVGRDLIIGATAKTVEQAQLAESSGADYLGVGAVFPSPTKQNARRITAEELREICASVSIPAVAIGGIGLHNMHEIRGCGMCGIAVVSAIFAAQNIQRAAAELRVKARELV